MVVFFLKQNFFVKKFCFYTWEDRAVRAQGLTLYVIRRSSKEQTGFLKKLGKHKVGGGCLYIKKLSDVDADVLKKVIEKGVQK